MCYLWVRGQRSVMRSVCTVGPRWLMWSSTGSDRLQRLNLQLPLSWTWFSRYTTPLLLYCVLILRVLILCVPVLYLLVPFPCCLLCSFTLYSGSYNVVSVVVLLYFCFQNLSCSFCRLFFSVFISTGNSGLNQH